jgi:hypothetical protein
MSDDLLLTYADLEARWRIAGKTDKSRRKTLLRRLELWGLRPLEGTRGKQAVFRPADVLKAEQRAA